jgi:hypothetical protein
MVDQISGADGALASENLTLVTGIALTDTVSVSDVFTFKFYPGGLISDSAKATDSASYGAKAGGATFADAAKASDAWLIKRVISQSSSANATESYTLTRNTRVSEKVRATDSASATAQFHLSQATSAKATDSWTVLTAEGWSDSAAAHDSVTVTYKANAVLTDSAAAGEYYVAVRTAHVVVVSTALASDTPLLQGAYQVTLSDLVIAGETWTLSGDSTAWAVNTRTQAVTEYRGFNYNSFATIGRKYIAADANGIYELNGPSDDGVKVIASLTGGYLEPNGGKFAGLKGVYVGVTGQGEGSTPDWLLKLDTGDGREFSYQTSSNPGLMSTKFRIGKGLKSRFMGWHVETVDGQDFSFNSIEFIPSMSGRRV